MSKEETKFDVKAEYEAYSAGKKTINQIADDNQVEALAVTQAFEEHVQSTKGKNK